MRVKSKFSLSISEVAVFLGKSPVTLRSWERKDGLSYPRHGSDRRLATGDIRDLARWARSKGRITEDRLQIVEATLTMMEIVENE